jgi:hypothetical protein
MGKLPMRDCSDANFVGGFGRVVRAARAEAHELCRFGFAAHGRYGAKRQNETFRGKKHNRGIAVLVVCRRVRMTMAGRIVRMMAGDIMVLVAR